MNRMDKTIKMRIIYRLIFIRDNPIEIIMEADSPVECHMKAICHANIYYPHWQGIKVVKRYLLNDDESK